MSQANISISRLREYVALLQIIRHRQSKHAEEEAASPHHFCAYKMADVGHLGRNSLKITSFKFYAVLIREVRNILGRASSGEIESKLVRD